VQTTPLRSRTHICVRTRSRKTDVYNAPVRLLRFFGLVLYASYLTYVGLLFLVSPWSSLWPQLMMMLPIRWSSVLDAPAVRGLISGIGALHFVMAGLELWHTRPDRQR